MGKSVVILGAQWGDEGKGKIVDLLTDRVKIRSSLPRRSQRRSHTYHQWRENRITFNSIWYVTSKRNLLNW